jgi:hypothetical protein
MTSIGKGVHESQWLFEWDIRQNQENGGLEMRSLVDVEVDAYIKTMHGGSANSPGANQLKKWRKES